MSRMVPGGARPEWPDDPEHGQGHDGAAHAQGAGAQGNGYGYDSRRGNPTPAQPYGPEYGRGQYGQYDGPAQGRAQGAQEYGPPWTSGAQPSRAQPAGAPDYAGVPDYRTQGQGGQGGQDWGYDDQQTRTYAQPGAGDPRGYEDTRRYEPQGQYGDGRPYQGRGQGPGGPARPGQRPARGPARHPARKVRFPRARRLFRRRSVRIVSAVLGVFLVWVTFSAGQAALKSNGQGVAANLAEWARDHYLGPIITLAEWATYNPPKVGGKPTVSLAGGGQAVTSVNSSKTRHKGFVADIPATLKPLASGPALPGEGQWSVIEKVKGEPAILTTRLRDGGLYTSYVNGIASIDQRLVKFSLRPGTEDPGSGNWGVPNYIPAGSRTGLLATFNNGFKLDAAAGGFYLNGIYHGSLVTGAASVVYYKNGSIKVGQWGRDFTLNSSIVGVRQNLKLLIDHGKISPNLNQDIETNFGATLGGSYYVWRSGLGITKDGRIVYVYGPELGVQDLANLLARAGAVEGMQMDINPAWMKFDYYTADGNPGNPVPTPLLPNQQPSAYSYYTPSTRDFTAVYAR